MFKGLFTIVLMTLSYNASAFNMDRPLFSVAELQNNATELAQAQPAAINWRVGESADYKINAGFLPGTMKMFVREATSRGYWIEQNVDVIIQKQKVEIHIDKNTGEVIELIVNGKPQAPQENDAEVVDNSEDTVTVPAGTFDCLYIKTRNSKGEEAEMWANPQVVAVFGLVKMASQAQGQTVTVELTAFEK